MQEQVANYQQALEVFQELHSLPNTPGYTSDSGRYQSGLMCLRPVDFCRLCGEYLMYHAITTSFSPGIIFVVYDISVMLLSTMQIKQNRMPTIFSYVAIVI